MSQASLSLSLEERTRIDRVDQTVAAGDGAPRELVEMLTDGSWAVRRAVIAGLAALGDAAIPDLVDALMRRRDDENRIAALVDALVQSTGDADAPLLELAGGPGASRDPALVADAASILGRRRSLAAVGTLQRLTAGVDDNVAVAALEALGRIGGGATIEPLIGAARSKNFFRVFPALDVLGRSGDPRAVAPIAELLQDPIYTNEAARALARTGDKAAVPALGGLLTRSGLASLRIASTALSELFGRAAERYGSTTALFAALKPFAETPALVRRLTDALPEADPTEQAAFCFVLGALATPEAIAALTTLSSASPPVGAASARALVRLARDAEPDLLSLLRTGGSEQRLSVLPLLRTRTAAAAVAVCLSDPDARVRVLACEALARTADAAFVPELFARLEDPDSSVVHAAMTAIQAFGGAEVERRALALAAHRSDATRRAAVRILAYFGCPGALDALIKAAKDRDERVRDAALGGLALMDDPRAFAALLRAARKGEPRARAAAVKAFGHRPLDADATTFLVESLSDDDAWVRYFACQSLGRQKVVSATSAIVDLLDDPGGQVRVAAVEALSHLDNALARRALLDAADSREMEVQRAALVGLGMTRHPSVLPKLLSFVDAPEAMIRLIVVSALSDFDSDDAIRALRLAARDESDSVRTAALGVLGTRPGKLASLALIELLEDAPSASAVVTALTAPVAGRVAVISAALPASRPETAAHLVSVLARMRTAEAGQALLSAFSLPREDIRRNAATALAAIGTPAATDALRHCAEADPDPGIRSVCSLLLA